MGKTNLESEDFNGSRDESHGLKTIGIKHKMRKTNTIGKNDSDDSFEREEPESIDVAQRNQTFKKG